MRTLLLCCTSLGDRRTHCGPETINDRLAAVGCCLQVLKVFKVQLKQLLPYLQIRMCENWCACSEGKSSLSGILTELHESGLTLTSLIIVASLNSARACTYACIRVCMSCLCELPACLLRYTQSRTHTGTRMHAHERTCTHAHTRSGCLHVRMCVRIYIATATTTSNIYQYIPKHSLRHMIKPYIRQDNEDLST